MTTVYFIRHAQAASTVRDGRTRPLTEKGLKDRRLATDYLRDKKIDVVFSSPFKRAVDTVADFAAESGLEIHLVEDFRERRGDSDMNWQNPDFTAFLERQWADFSYTFSDGECLADVQKRNIDALNEILVQYRDRNIVVGTHGTALSTIINYYDRAYGFADFMEMVEKLPWAVKMTFDGITCVHIDRIDLFA